MVDEEEAARGKLGKNLPYPNVDRMSSRRR